MITAGRGPSVGGRNSTPSNRSPNHTRSPESATLARIQAVVPWAKDWPGGVRAIIVRPPHKERERVAERPLDGKVAIVTGAGSTIGFGRAMTLALVQAGARGAM